MKKYQLTDDMALYRKYWMTKIMAGHAKGDGQKCEKSLRIRIFTAHIIITLNADIPSQQRS